MPQYNEMSRNGKGRVRVIGGRLMRFRADMVIPGDEERKFNVDKLTQEETEPVTDRRKRRQEKKHG